MAAKAAAATVTTIDQIPSKVHRAPSVLCADRETLKHREMELELRRAQEDGDFELAYQPLFASNGEMFCLEALLRLDSPRLGRMMPSEFIPVAEATHLIEPVGAWALREACRQNMEWRNAGFRDTAIAVNVSAIQFAQNAFDGLVAEVLREAGMPGEALILEMTESTVMRDPASTAWQMRRLKRLGVRIAIDDFGTGYSSLSYLHHLPVDILKIDQFFIAGLQEEDSTLPIVRAIVSMAHALGHFVVAEGVETQEQAATLRECGCELFQGHLFSRPVSAQGASALLQARGGAREVMEPVKRMTGLLNWRGSFSTAQ